MGMSRLTGLLAIIPVTLLLTLSFFVLIVLRKIETQGLKALGYTVCVLLWISALLVFSSGISTLSTGYCPLMYKMRGLTKDRAHWQMKAQEAPAEMPGEKAPAK